MPKYTNSRQYAIFWTLLAGSILGLVLGSVPLKVLSFFVLVYDLAGIRVIYEYERGVLFTLGKFSGLLNPGIVWIAPAIQSIRKVDLRVRAVDIPEQEVVTRDNVSIKVNGVVFFKVEDPEKAILNVENYRRATILYAQTVLRDVIGSHDLDEVLQKREQIGEIIRKIVDEISNEWGIRIVSVKLQDIIIPENMKSIIARQAEAEREKRSNIIKSEGELIAAQNLVKAAEMMSKAPAALTLRVLHTLSDISKDPNQKVLLILPIELLEFLKREKSEHK
ncbi:MAG: slipin family protein [Crenarchaeota archaeon]|nr:slipin family protein [Thermoproteota archaeon]